MHKEIPRKPPLSAGRPSRRQAYSESEQEESEYETDGEDIEMSPLRKRDELPDDEDEYEEEEEEEEDKEAEEDGGANTASEVEEEVYLSICCNFLWLLFISLSLKGILDILHIYYVTNNIDIACVSHILTM